MKRTSVVFGVSVLAFGALGISPASAARPENLTYSGQEVTADWSTYDEETNVSTDVWVDAIQASGDPQAQIVVQRVLEYYVPCTVDGQTYMAQVLDGTYTNGLGIMQIAHAYSSADVSITGDVTREVWTGCGNQPPVIESLGTATATLHMTATSPVSKGVLHQLQLIPSVLHSKIVWRTTGANATGTLVWGDQTQTDMIGSIAAIHVVGHSPSLSDGRMAPLSAALQAEIAAQQASREAVQRIFAERTATPYPEPTPGQPAYLSDAVWATQTSSGTHVTVCSMHSTWLDCGPGTEPDILEVDSYGEGTGTLLLDLPKLGSGSMTAAIDLTQSVYNGCTNEITIQTLTGVPVTLALTGQGPVTSTVVSDSWHIRGQVSEHLQYSSHERAATGTLTVGQDQMTTTSALLANTDTRDHTVTKK